MENIKKTNQTWVVLDINGKIINRTSRDTLKEYQAVYYGKLKDIIKLISYKEFLQMETLEVLNKGFDKVKHKPITKDEITKMLKEEM